MEEDSARAQAAASALATALWYQVQLTGASASVRLMGAFVEYEPQYDAVARLFNSTAPVLLQQAPPGITKQLEYIPNGVLRQMYPVNTSNGGELGFDLFAGRNKDFAVRAVAARNLSLVGPTQFYEGGYGVILRWPIFIRGVDASETFGLPDPLNPFCGAACAYDPATRTKFWGFASAVIDLDELHNSSDSRTRMLVADGYRFEVIATGPVATQSVVFASSTLPEDPVEAVAHLPNAEWVVRVSPNDGWSSPAYPGLLTVVIVGGFVLAVLIFTVLVSRKKHQLLLEALLPKALLRDLNNNDPTRIGPRIIQTETTADLILTVLSQLLEGVLPDVRDVVFARQAILKSHNIYQPMHLGHDLRQANLDNEVARALMHQLGTSSSAHSLHSGMEGDDGLDGMGSEDTHGAGCTQSPRGSTASHTGSDWGGMAKALTLILAPQLPTWPDAPATAGVATALEPDTSDVPVAGVVAITRGTGHGLREAVAELPTSGSMSVGPTGSSSQGVIARAMSFFKESAVAATSRRGSIELTGAERSPRVSLAPGGMLPGASGEKSPTASPARMRVASRRMSLVFPDAAAAAAIAEGPEGTEAGDLPEPTAALAGRLSGGGELPQCAPKARRPPRKVVSAASLAGSGGRSYTYTRRKSLLHATTNAQDLPPKSASAKDTAAADDDKDDEPLQSQRSRLAGQEGSTQGPSSAVHAAVASVGGMPVPMPGPAMLQGYSRRSMSLMAGAGGKLQPVAPSPPPPALIEEVEKMLAGVDSWTFDMWHFKEVTQGHALSALGFYLFQRSGLLRRYKIKPPMMARLLRHIEAGYQDNAYHNATHAADVLQTLHVIIHGAQLHVHYLDSLGLLAAYWAAIVHDYGHPGLTNDFLINTADPLAVRYNDRSPLENHHAAASFSAMRRPELDFTASLSKSEKAAFRKQVIDMILATDMKQHFSLISQFNTVHRLAAFSAGPVEATVPSARNMTTSGPQVYLSDAGRVSASNIELQVAAPQPVDENEKLLSLQLAMKAADLGHLGEQLEVHKKWLAGLEEEFFRQGDKEKALGLPISPLFDRAKQGVSKSQVGFYDFVALPLVHALTSRFPGAQPLMRTFVSNYNHWRGVEGQPPISMPTPVIKDVVGEV
ncbi:hypothetical protein HYH03_016064 [Edaphochlamys debaryana]|uniref:Phosphodiesterase n=1 Tax=Edaphochlamys debaryana TaxID=47281 RepID=A0A835XKJ7_9CHLO|nr:hypothetical protein HYH03_016064 [Edaphochlamys debaryana]|eukprot:KAG2485174.1 hypothetical protein HYH03_016064 [Edaphochlamys debaryana]